MQTKMKSLNFPSDMRRLARTLPLISVANGQGPWVSGKKLHRLLGQEKDFEAWTAFWASEWRAWVEWGWESDIGEPLRGGGDGDTLIFGALAVTMALNPQAPNGVSVSAYLHHAERRWRILNGGLLSALEIADEYHLIDRRTNATRRIGDAICRFAVRHADMPPIGDVGGHSRRKRGFPAALIRAWHRDGGGAEVIEAERGRSKRPVRSRPQPDMAVHEDDAMITLH